MKITEIKSLDLFKYSLVILTGSIVFILFPFVLLLLHYKQQSKTFLVNFYYIFSCFGVAILLLNAYLLFWILNQLIKSNNAQRIQQFDTIFFQLLNYVHETAGKMNEKDLSEVNFSIKNFISENMHTFNNKEDAVAMLKSSFRNSVLKNEASVLSDHYFRQLNTLLVYLLTAQVDIDRSKYIAIIEAEFV